MTKQLKTYRKSKHKYINNSNGSQIILAQNQQAKQHIVTTKQKRTTMFKLLWFRTKKQKQHMEKQTTTNTYKTNTDFQTSLA